MAEKNIKVRKDEVNPETPEVLAASLIRIADAFTAIISQGELKQEAVVALLLGMDSRLRKGEVKLVLENLTRLKAYYVRQKPSKS